MESTGDKPKHITYTQYTLHIQTQHLWLGISAHWIFLSVPLFAYLFFELCFMHTYSDMDDLSRIDMVNTTCPTTHGARYALLSHMIFCTAASFFALFGWECFAVLGSVSCLAVVYSKNSITYCSSFVLSE
jgi:hypothetical protein